MPQANYYRAWNGKDESLADTVAASLRLMQLIILRIRSDKLTQCLIIQLILCFFVLFSTFEYFFFFLLVT